jgi:hypothetical protein
MDATEVQALQGHKVRAAGLVEKLARTRPGLFVHWRLGMTGEFA